MKAAMPKPIHQGYLLPLASLGRPNPPQAEKAAGNWLEATLTDSGILI
jgi:hypothetical protein